MRNLFFILLFCTLPLQAHSDIFRLSWCGTRLGVGIPHNSKNVSGLELGFGSSLDSINGLQLNLAYGRVDVLNGIQVSLLNKVSRSNAVQIGLRNISYEQSQGIQIGIINTANSFRGLQVGIINKVSVLTGLQVGIFNIAENGLFQSMLFLNGRF